MLGDIDQESWILLFVVTFFSCVMITLAATDLYIARAIVGFIYLTFIPGVILTRLLIPYDRDLLKAIMFSVGLSIAFLMIVGLTINFLFPIFGISNPLSPIPLLLSISVITEALTVLLLFLRKGTPRKIEISLSKQTKVSASLVLIFILLPLLAIIGTFVVNAYDNNIVLLIVIVLIALLTSIVAAHPRFNTVNAYAFVLCMIALALLLHSSLISGYIYGGDSHMEYQLFRITQNASYWNSTINSTDLGYNLLNAMLSITIFPTIYSNVLSLDGTWVFKIVGPAIFSLVCVALYLLYKREFDSRVAFVSVFFFMANSVFFNGDTIGNLRQMIAELFYVLLFLVLLEDKLARPNNGLLFLLFGTALVFSHYSVSYLFLFMALGMLLFKILQKRSWSNDAKTILGFSVIMFSWYISISNSGPFRGLVQTLDLIKDTFLNQFLAVGSRGLAVSEGVGLSGLSTFWHLIGRGFIYLTEVLILVGLVFLILKRKDKLVSDRYFALVLLNMAILGACLIVPSFSNTLNMYRFYHLALFFLAPLLAIGSLQILRFVKQNLRTEIGVGLIMLILVPFFLFQTGFVYEITGEVSYSIPLSKSRMDQYYTRRTPCCAIQRFSVPDGCFTSSTLTRQNMLILPKEPWCQ